MVIGCEDGNRKWYRMVIGNEDGNRICYRMVIGYGVTLFTRSNF
jgi:hypothetical protein